MLLVLAWTLGLVPSALATSTTQVSGRQVPVETCDGKAGAAATFEMSGDLVGCWYLDDFAPKAATPSGIFVGGGRETFVGCIRSRCGTLTFRFVFIGQYDATGAEIRGACHHPVVGGTGGLAGASGSINFVDDPDGSGLPPADYSGRINLTN
jgi:hypothetical protein